MSVRWVAVADGLPPLEGEDYGYRRESVEVLAFAGGRIHVARFTAELEDPDEWSPPSSWWILQGRDGYRLDGVTHWAFLPEGPT